MQYIKRHLETTLKDRLESRRSIYIFGARQTGKTTLLRHIFPDYSYISLENPSHFDFATTDPIGFLNQFQTPCILDEIQRLPSLFSYLQEYIDIKGQKFILTGSQNFLMMESISQSLAGRISLLELSPLSQSELQNRPNICLADHVNNYPASTTTINDLWENILSGHYPEVHQISDPPGTWYADYVRTFVERDIRLIINVQDLSQYQRFLQLCAGRSGQLLNIHSLSNDLGLSPTQCKKWLNVLEQSGIIYLLKPYYENFNKRVIKSPKLYFCDTGLLCHLLSITDSATLKTHPLTGFIVENFAINEIRKSYQNDGIQPELYFYRDSNGFEVDLLLKDRSELYAIEIKSTQTLHSTLYSTLSKWKSLHPDSHKILFYGGSDTVYRQDIHTLPIACL